MRFDPKLTVLAALLASACAIAPPANQQLEEARAAFRSAAADQAVQANALVELKSAEDALLEAERLVESRGPSELVEHNAYLAEQRSRIAMRTAEIRGYEASIAAAAEERRRIQQEAREREAAAVREQAQQAQLQAQQSEAARKEAESRAAALQNEKLDKERQSSARAALGAEVKRMEGDLRAKETNRGWILTLKNEVLFDAGGATLQPGAQRALDNLAQLLKKYPDREIAIEGFTDSTGSKDLNQQLSERRAWAVKAALVARGIPSNRIDARGYGPSFPVASNETPTGRQLNRRVEIVIDPS